MDPLEALRANAPFASVIFLALATVSLAPLWRYFAAIVIAMMGRFASWRAFASYLYFGRPDAFSTLTREQRTSRLAMNVFINGIFYVVLVFIWAGYLRHK